MKIAFVIPSLSAGGAERVATFLANEWSKKGHTLTIVKLDSEEAFYPLEKEINVFSLNLNRPTLGIFQKIFENFRRIAILRNTLKSIAPDVIISFITEMNILTIFATLNLNIPVLISERTSHKHSVGWMWSIFRKITYPLSTRLIVQTERAVNAFGRNLRKKTIVIPNPIENIPLIEKQHSDENKRTIISIGRLVSLKGFDVLLEAFALLEAEYPDWDLVIVGEGPEGDRLKRLAQRLEIRNRISFLTAIKNVYEKLRDSTLFVLASRYEGFPNALCEAMAVGLPVIATDCDNGPAEIIRPGIDGWLVPVDDPNALSLSMRKLMDDPELRASFGNRAREISKRFSKESVMAIWEKLIYDVTQGKGFS